MTNPAPEQSTAPALDEIDDADQHVGEPVKGDVDVDPATFTEEDDDDE